MKDEDWIVKCVNEAHQAHPSVTDSAVTRVQNLIMGKTADHQLSTTELREIAKSLLADIAPPASPKTGVTDAD